MVRDRTAAALILLVIPLAFFWAVTDWMLRWYQVSTPVYIIYLLRSMQGLSHISRYPRQGTCSTQYSTRLCERFINCGRSGNVMYDHPTIDRTQVRVYKNLQDPPFIHGGWSAAPFTALI
ncbi:hypothetical protein BDR07DRAFT_164868 [Suillus spraguei]|nr:hypothetical protein BDR07DRAFT_164868 [Suillus spraguei]